MSTVEQIEAAIRKLSDEELSRFREWFARFDAALWDRQFEQDVEAGRLDERARQALDDARKGRCTDL